jgi:hypothetical protein
MRWSASPWSARDWRGGVAVAALREHAERNSLLPRCLAQNLAAQATATNVTIVDNDDLATCAWLAAQRCHHGDEAPVRDSARAGSVERHVQAKTLLKPLR